jgi:hypothetical protein
MNSPVSQSSAVFCPLEGQPMSDLLTEETKAIIMMATGDEKRSRTSCPRQDSNRGLHRPFH